MIFVTVGSQMPFDRLISATEAWAATHPEVEVFAQIGRSELRPRALKWTQALVPADYRSWCARADLIVGHAGVGTIMSVLEAGKPLIVMPRRGYLRETRDDHQVETAKWLSSAGNIRVANDEIELATQLDRYAEMTPCMAPLDQRPATKLIANLRAYITGA